MAELSRMARNPSLDERIGWLISEGHLFRERVFQLGTEAKASQFGLAVELLDLVVLQLAEARRRELA